MDSDDESGTTPFRIDDDEPIGGDSETEEFASLGLGLKRRKLTKEEQIYGVFYEGSDDEEGGGRRGGVRSTGKGDYSAPMNFMSAGRLEEQKYEGSSEEEEGKSVGKKKKKKIIRRKKPTEDPYADLPKAFGVQRKKSIRSQKRRFAAEEEKVDEEVPSAKEFKKGAKGIGEFEKHTKGFGLRMLEKMGFKGRLGRNEEGIKEHIKVKVRPHQLGLGFGGFQEASRLNKENKDLSGIVSGKKGEKEEVEEEESEVEVVYVSESEESEGEAASARKAEKSEKYYWKKGQQKRKVQFKTAQELIASATESDGKGGVAATVQKKVVITDMTGAKPRILTSLSEAPLGSTTLDFEGTGKSREFPELRHNLKLLVEFSEMTILNADKKGRTARDRVAMLDKEVDKLERELEVQKEIESEVEQISAMITSLTSKKSVGTQGAAQELDEAITVFLKLKQDSPTLYRSQKLWEGLAAIALEKLKWIVAVWNPFTEPFHSERQRSSTSAIVFRSCQRLFEALGPKRPEKVVDDNVDLWRESKRKMTGASAEEVKCLEAILWHAWLPRVRALTMSQWEPRNPEATDKIASMLTSYENIMPPSIYRAVSLQVVLPRLQHAVDMWNPTAEVIPVHSWLHPWLPILGTEAMATLYPTIRHKLSLALSAWHPSDASAFAVLKPWKGVFDPPSFDAIMHRQIMPKLRFALRNLEVDPRQQSTEPIQWLFRWRELIGDDEAAKVIAEELMPRWLKVLHHWLVHSPNFDEVMQWYLWWKGVFGVVGERLRLKVILTRALDMMNERLSSTDGQVSFPDLERLKWEGEGKAAGARSSTSVSAAARPDLLTQGGEGAERGRAINILDEKHTFKEIIELLAEENGLAFLPKIGKKHDNKQVFLFGDLQVVLGNRVVEILEDGEWKLCGVEDLVRKAKGG